MFFSQLPILHLYCDHWKGCNIINNLLSLASYNLPGLFGSSKFSWHLLLPPHSLLLPSSQTPCPSPMLHAHRVSSSAKAPGSHTSGLHTCSSLFPGCLPESLLLVFQLFTSSEKPSWSPFRPAPPTSPHTSRQAALLYLPLAPPRPLFRHISH